MEPLYHPAARSTSFPFFTPAIDYFDGSVYNGGGGDTVTLQNLRYVVEVANSQSFSKAAQSLFMTQSALSSAIREVEQELGIAIFRRTNRGVQLTPDGEDCLKYCKEIIERADYLSIRFQNRGSLRTYFSVSSQHLPFAVRAFDELLEGMDPAGYDVAIRETETMHILHDVSTGRSELGVVAMTERQKALINKSLYIHDLSFDELARLNTYVFMRRRHPLAECEALTLDDLRPYPFVTYDQDQAPDYYSEESLFFAPMMKNIHVSDRATKMSVIRSTDAFSVGVDLPNFNQDIYFKLRNTEMVAIPFADHPEPILIGALTRNGRPLTEIAKRYIELLISHIEMLRVPTAQ